MNVAIQCFTNDENIGRHSLALHVPCVVLQSLLNSRRSTENFLKIRLIWISTNLIGSENVLSRCTLSLYLIILEW